MWTWFHRLASPPSFFRFSDTIAPWLLLVSVGLLAYGLYAGLWLAPPDYQQGDAFRIIYVHVPAAALSLSLYSGMAIAGIVALIWGAWWKWDARLTSELVLLFLYLGVIGLNSAFADRRTAARACALLAIVGAVNVPIVKYSVDWWNSLHQSSIILKFGKPTITPEMGIPLYISLLGSYLLAVWAVLRRMQNELLDRESRANWVRSLLSEKAAP